MAFLPRLDRRLATVFFRLFGQVFKGCIGKSTGTRPELSLAAWFAGNARILTHLKLLVG
jgi:hypothetical protein